MADIEGVIPAIPTPMTPEGGVNETALRAIIEFNIQVILTQIQNSLY